MHSHRQKVQHCVSREKDMKTPGTPGRGGLRGVAEEFSLTSGKTKQQNSGLETEEVQLKKIVSLSEIPYLPIEHDILISCLVKPQKISFRHDL